MSEEKKVLDFKIEDDKMLLTVDPNKDGQPVLSLAINLKEVPDEIISAIK